MCGGGGGRVGGMGAVPIILRVNSSDIADYNNIL